MLVGAIPVPWLFPSMIERGEECRFKMSIVVGDRRRRLPFWISLATIIISTWFQPIWISRSAWIDLKLQHTPHITDRRRLHPGRQLSSYFEFITWDTSYFSNSSLAFRQLTCVFFLWAGEVCSFTLLSGRFQGPYCRTKTAHNWWGHGCKLSVRTWPGFPVAYESKVVNLFSLNLKLQIWFAACVMIPDISRQDNMIHANRANT